VAEADLTRPRAECDERCWIDLHRDLVELEDILVELFVAAERSTSSAMYPPKPPA
jgi:hypothetical protein